MDEGVGGGGQPQLVEGCLNAGPRAGLVTRLAYRCRHTPAVFDYPANTKRLYNAGDVGPTLYKCYTWRLAQRRRCVNATTQACQLLTEPLEHTAYHKYT